MLHRLHTNKLSRVLINRIHILIHSLAVSLFLYHRATTDLLFSFSNITAASAASLLLFLAELFLFFLWALEQAYRWRPVTRSVFPENLPSELGPNYEAQLPAIDVFICTADPEKEPTVEVMNTLISAMALDYPPDKLHIYLSDDGGAEETLRAAREAWSFATWWIPFCRKYGLKTRCPVVYFDQEEDGVNMSADSDQFRQDRIQIKEKYDTFKEQVRDNLLRSREGTKRKTSSRDHPPIVEVINENCASREAEFPNRYHVPESEMPTLVYVAREKRSSHAHHFKAGALNALLRVSGLLSNSPIVLVLDCDMYCTDSTSIKQAICFHLDPDISPTLAFVQFPQRFRNVSRSDIYDSGLKRVFKVLWSGLDGAQGPILSGTGFYIKRTALYDSNRKGFDNIMEQRGSFGSSNDFMKTLNGKENYVATSRNLPRHLQEEVRFLASCSYEDQTEWGNKIGFMYHSVLEDYLTGFTLHINGWRSVYHDPSQAQFLGTAVNNLNDALIQGSRWSSGLIEVSLSRFCPLFYRPLSKISLVQRLCYAQLGLSPLYFLPVWCFATIPQLCLLHGVPLYPKASTSFFPVIVFIFMSSLLRSMYEVLVTMEGSFSFWSNHWRMWIVKSLTSHTYGSLDAIMKNIGLRELSFIPTNKVMNDEQVKRYQLGMYDFQTSSMFLVPMGMTVILNMTCFLGGVAKVITRENWDEMFAQLLLSGVGLIFSWPIIEGIIVRKDSGRFPLLAFAKSALASILIVLVSFQVFGSH